MPPSDDLKTIKDRRPTKADEDEYGLVWMEPEPLTDRPFVAVCAAHVGHGVPWCHTEEWVEPQPLPEIKVGQVWRRADGEHAVVTRDDKRGMLPLHIRSEKDGTFYYTRLGKAVGAHEGIHLVELIKDVPTDPAPQPVPEPAPHPEKPQVGQEWRTRGGKYVTIVCQDSADLFTGTTNHLIRRNDLLELIAHAKVPRLFAEPPRRTALPNNMCYLDAIADDGTCWWMGPDRGGWAQYPPLPDREEPTND